jgi:hypothetical protein
MIGNPLRSEPPSVPAMPMRTIEGPAAWRGLDLGSSGDFAHQLTDAEIVEIDAAVAAIMQGGIDHIAIDQRNFELPRLGKYLSSARDDILLRGRGFMVIRGVPVERYSIAEAPRPLSGLAPTSANRCRRMARATFWAM